MHCPTRRLRGRLQAPLLDGRDNRTAEVRAVRVLAAEIAGQLGRLPNTLEWSALLDAATLSLRLRDARLADDQRVSLGFALDAALRRAGVQPAQRSQPEPDPRAQAMARIDAFRRGG